MKTMKVSQKGQTIVLFALGLLALLAMAALLVDGGQSYMHRRQAQAAADAGALAGAKELCEGDEDAARAIAYDYAVNQNGASPTTTADIVGEDLVVTAHIAQKSFFAQLIGLNEVDVVAEAAAKCGHPGAMPVLPVAWSCQHPLDEQPTESEDCQYLTLDYTTEILSHLDADGNDNGFFDTEILHDMYIAMDPGKTEQDMAFSCIPYGPINCNLDEDPENEFSGGGARGWLDLGKKNIDLMCGRIEEPPIVRIHEWRPAEPGAVASNFKHVKSCIENKVVFLPVFNAVCKDDPLNPGNSVCYANAHTNFPWPEDGSDNMEFVQSGKYNYHISGIAPFFVSCVANNQDDCPGNTAANVLFDYKTKLSIEGYFVSGYDFSSEAGMGGMDLGVDVISLTR